MNISESAKSFYSNYFAKVYYDNRTGNAAQANQSHDIVLSLLG